MKIIKILLFFLLSTFVLTDVNAQVFTRLGAVIEGEVLQDRSGSAVSLSADGTTIAIGAYKDDGNGTDAGNVRVFQYISGAWTQLGTDIDGEAPYDWSGHSVSLSDDGTIVAIGAPYNYGDEDGNRPGHVRVYKFIAGAWTQLGADIDGEGPYDLSGWSVSLNGDGTIVAIGAHKNDGNGINAGHVRVYKFISGAWTQLGGDIEGEATDDWSGHSVSLSDDGTTLAIGAPHNDDGGDNAGQVRVYKFISGAWTQLGDDIDGKATDDWSGYSVSLSDDGTTVAIGAPYHDGISNYSGQVRVYKYISGAWTQLGALIDGGVDDVAGIAVSLNNDGTILAIGASGYSGFTMNCGRVKVYQLISGVWTQVGTAINGELFFGQIGASVRLSEDGTIVAIGALAFFNLSPVTVYEIHFPSTGLFSDKLANMESVKVFPNPATDRITLEYHGKYDVHFYDLYGRRVLEKYNLRNKAELDVGMLGAGMYFYLVFDNNKIITSGNMLIEK